MVSRPSLFSLFLLFSLPFARSAFAPLSCSGDYAADSEIALSNMETLSSASVGDNQQFLSYALGMSVIINGASPDGGGGTNPDGVYWGPITDAASLPADACTTLTGAFMEQCYPSDPRPPGEEWTAIMDVFDDRNITVGTLQTMMGVNDVQVWYGCSPPGVRYFGFDTIISARAMEGWAPPKTKDDLFHTWNPGINFADPVNSVNTGLGTYAKSEPMAVIYSADSKSAAAAAKMMEELVPTSSIHTLSLDQDIFRPVLGDRSTLDGWKASKPDNLRHLVRYSIPDPEDTSEYEGYLKSYFPFFTLLGDPALATEDTALRNLPSEPREVDALETDEVDYEGFRRACNSAHEKDGYTTETKAYTRDDEKGLYDDWDSFLADGKWGNLGNFPAGTRDCTYGIESAVIQDEQGDAQTQYLSDKPTRIVVTGVDHTKTSYAAAYGQVLFDIFTGEERSNELRRRDYWVSHS